MWSPLAGSSESRCEACRSRIFLSATRIGSGLTAGFLSEDAMEQTFSWPTVDR